MSAALHLENVSVEFPVFYAPERSLKRNLLGGSGHGLRINALQDINLSLGRGSRTALLGGNASGKTTLLRAAAGLLQPSKGSVVRQGRAFAVLNVGLGVDPDLSAYNTAIGHGLLAGHDVKESRRRAEMAMEFGELDDKAADTPIKLLGPGQRLRLGTGIATALEANILLFDEVLEHAGPEFLDRLMGYIRQGPPSQGAVLMVERAAGLLLRFCDRAIVLENGQVTDQGELASVVQRHAGRYVI
ncbi:ABC transporter ATP-binding protein [Ferrovibrio sp.]|uniref:ABC transporter ATP-binding protein n=1 Tax=Ferrovibrio sp. TaxID=1917215 RepID=UPI003D120631